MAAERTTGPQDTCYDCEEAAARFTCADTERHGLCAECARTHDCSGW